MGAICATGEIIILNDTGRYEQKVYLFIWWDRLWFYLATH